MAVVGWQFYTNNGVLKTGVVGAGGVGDADTLDGIDSTGFLILASGGTVSGNTTFSGAINVTTQAPGNNTTLAASTAFVQAAIGAISAVSSLDDLSDVDMTTNVPLDGDLMRFDGANWIPYVQVIEEDLSGQVDGITAAFTVASAPETAPLKVLRVYLDGMRMLEGVAADYALAGTTITFTFVPLLGQTLLVDYEYER